jgi:hypothetical protein
MNSKSYNAAYYQRNRGRILEKSKERLEHAKKRPLETEISRPTELFPEKISRPLEKLAPNFKGDQAFQAKDDLENRFQSGFNPWLDILDILKAHPLAVIILHLVFGLTILLICMQVEFYNHHEVSKGFAVPLAISCELSLVMLVYLRFQHRFRNFLRLAAYLLLFSYVVGGLSFDVFYTKRMDSQSQKPTLKETEINEKIKILTKSLEVATKGRSWSNMKFFGDELNSLGAQLDGVRSSSSLGIKDEDMIMTSAVFIIVLRGLLILINSLLVEKLLEIFTVNQALESDGVHVLGM